VNEELSINPASLSVSIGFPCGTSIPHQTTFSLLKTLDACLRARISFNISHKVGCPLVPYARSLVVHQFLKGNASRLFWIDSDMEWEPSEFMRLLALSTKVDVVCATYPTKTDDQEIFVKHPDLRTVDLHKYGLVKIHGTGLGFCCVTREVIEALVATKPRIYDPALGEEIADVFRLDTTIDNEGRTVGRGEDMAFFADLRELGCDVWLDPTIKLGHIGSKTYRTDPLKALRLESVFNPELKVA